MKPDLDSMTTAQCAPQRVTKLESLRGERDHLIDRLAVVQEAIGVLEQNPEFEKFFERLERYY